MKKIVFIAPHLSTGGMPQYLVKQIELIKDECEVYCVEWGNVTGGVLVVQRNKVVKLLGNKLITLGENKHELFDVINTIKPDVIHLQEIPELFMEQSVADKLYRTDRDYILIETSHDSGYNPNTNKTYLPDKFLMVSQYQANLYKDIDVPCDVVEYPIENKTRTKTREQALRDLGLDPNLKHVINVGLFTPRKNQAEVIEYARILQNYPIQFHFIGNQADNFHFYWEPLMKNFPPNCKWWNERSDVDNFYEAADLFLFTSRGGPTDHETMPLVIREALSWKTPSMIYNLPVYMGYFDKYNTIEYLKDDIQENAYRIAEKLLRDNSENKTMTNTAQVKTVNGEQIIFNGTPVNVKVPKVITTEPVARIHSDTPTVKQDKIKKEVYIIGGYPTSEAKQEWIKDLAIKLKKLGKDTMVVSHYPLPDYIINELTYYIYDADNMLDTKHTLENTEPDYWVDNNLFRIETMTSNHTLSVSRIFSLGMDFAKILGYEKFILVESDSIFDLDDLRKYDDILAKMEQQNKKMFFCKPKYSEFNWHGQPVYETYSFGGYLDEFLSKFRFPSTPEKWNELADMMNRNFCLESIIYKHFHTFENDYLILGTLKSEFLRSKIDLTSNSNHSGVYYNLNDEYKPVLFLLNQNEDNLEYRIMTDLEVRRISLNKQCWSYDTIDLNAKDNINIRVELWIDNKFISSKTEIVSRENIKNKKKYRTIKFK